MEKMLSIEEFYQSKMNWMPDNLQKEMGHFNVFRIEDFAAHTGRPLPYSRKDFFKISLIIGKTRIHYADKIVEINERALLFANPHIPYTWEQLEDRHSGVFCIFTDAFFSQFGNLKDYPVFKPGGDPIFDLQEEQAAHIRDIFER